jgi:DNA modification methylase
MIGLGIHLGNCLQLLKEVTTESIDMVFMDLPYGCTAADWDTQMNLRVLWPLLWSAVKPKGIIVATAQMPFAAILAGSQIHNLRYDLIWYKTLATGHLQANIKPMRAHESILIFYRQKGTYNPQKTSGHSLSHGATSNIKESSVLYRKQKTTVYVPSTERYPTSVLQFKKDTQLSKLHPTQKPVALLEYLIKTYSNEGDIILDPTSGSGTTAIAAYNTNRKSICIEKDSAMYQKSIARLADHIFTPDKSV